MSSNDDLERRMAAVESELAVVREESSAARALASGADRDVAEYRAELRAHTRMLTALRKTQIEHYELLQGAQSDHYADHKADTASLKARVTLLRESQLEHHAELKADLSSVRGDVATLKVDMSEVKTDVATLKVDMSEVKTDVATLKVDMSEVKTDVAGLKGDVTELKTDMSGVKTGVARIIRLLEERGEAA